MAIDLAAFKLAFPEWKDCEDGQLEFWADLSGCMICLPKGCPALATRLPHLMLAHILRINDVKCAAVVDPDADPNADACTCDDEMLTTILNSGARISSVAIEGMSASFDNSGVNQLVNNIGSSPFSAWLSSTKEGQLVAVILSRLNKGPHMALSAVGGGGVYADDHVLLGHTRITGSG